MRIYSRTIMLLFPKLMYRKCYRRWMIQKVMY